MHEQTTEKFTEVWRDMLAKAPRAAVGVRRALELRHHHAPHRAVRYDGPLRPARAGFDDQAQPMAVLDLRGRFKQLNPAFAKLVGYGEHEFGKAAWPSVLDRKVYKEQMAEFEQLILGKLENAEVQSTYMHSQGLMVPVVGEIRLVRGDRRRARTTCSWSPTRPRPTRPTGHLLRLRRRAWRSHA